MADLRSPNEDGVGVKNAVDEGTNSTAGSKLTFMSVDKEIEEAEGQRRSTDLATIGNDGVASISSLSELAVAVPQKDLGGARNQAEILSEAPTYTGWNGVGTMNRGSPWNETDNCDWATFSPISNSLSLDTSWAQNITSNTAADSREDSSNNRTSIDYKNPDVSAQVSESGPGWQAFSLGGSANSCSQTAQCGEECCSRDSTPYANSTHHPMLSVQRTDDSCLTQTQRVCTALPCHHPCVTVLRQCFTSSSLQNITSFSGEGDCVPQLVSTECVRDWEELGDTSFATSLWTWAQTSLHHPPPSSCQARLMLVLGVIAVDELESVPGCLVFPPGDEQRFDWTCPSQRRRPMTPDVVPNLFRPRKESLVNVNFDLDRAALGLAILSEVELQQTCDEMTSKFSRLSEELLTNLQLRDVMAGEMEVKNRFVSALLRVQQLRHSQDLNGGFGETGRGKQWVWSQKKRHEEPTGKYLQTVIPYKLPEGLKWRTDTLTQLTKVLKAIADGSSTVPKLMSEYLKSEFLTSPVTDRHSLNDPPVRNHKISTLSV